MNSWSGACTQAHTLKDYHLLKWLLLFVIAIGSVESPAQHFAWAKSYGTTPTTTINPATRGTAIAIGKNEQIFVAGRFTDSLHLGNGFILPRQSTSGQDGFIVRLDSGGTVQWAKSLGASISGAIERMTTATDGTIIAGGGFEGAIRLGADSLFTASPGSALLVKYDEEGVVIWHREFPGSINDLVLDQYDNIYLTVTNFVNLFFTSTIMKFNSKGDLIYNSLVHEDNNTSFVLLDHLVADGSGAIYASGLASGNAIIGNIPLTHAAPQGTFIILKCNKEGIPVRILNTLDIPIGGAFGSLAMTTDARANVFYSAFGDKLFLAKYDSAGNTIWKIDKQNALLGPAKLVLDEVGNIFVAADASGNSQLDHIDITNTELGLSHTLIGQFDPNGTLLWALQGVNEINGILFDLTRSRKTGDIYATGLLQGINTSYGGTLLAAPNINTQALVLKVKYNSTYKPLSIDLGPDTAICDGQSLQLSIPNDFVTHQWQDGSTGTSLVVTKAGKYYVTANDLTGYAYSDTIIVRVNPAPKVYLGSDTTLCTGATLTLRTGLGTAYHWQDNSTDSTFQVSSAGTYSVTVQNQFGCYGQGFIHINYLSAPKVDLGADRLECAGFTPLKAYYLNSTYAWSGGASDSAYTPTKAGKYWVVVQNQCGQASDTVSVFSLTDLSYPDVITPNHDGLNEKFQLLGTGEEQSGGILSIYNRWGEVIYSEQNYKNDWPQDENQAAGVYYFLLSFSGCPNSYKGWIQVVR